MEFNVDLYDFMKKRECKIWLRGKYNKEIKIGIFVNSYHVCEFMDCLDSVDFDDDGIICNMKQGYLFVELNSIFENNDYKIMDYAKCFKKDDIEYYKDYIKKFDQ